MMPRKQIRIGCASGFWGDSEIAAPQLVRGGQIDYLVFDYLAEITMSLLARARAKQADAGYATDFVRPTMAGLIREIAENGIRVISNAGGVNPKACRDALLKLADEAGLDLKVAVVLGDDLMSQRDALRGAGVREMFSGAPLPDDLMSVNAYLGARPIAAALDAGAQIVITGRCVDSAVTLGPLLHEFGWSDGDHDLLAAGSLAGHVIECGAQATGGLYTDWESVPDWENIGYPIAECAADGSFVVTKPEGTGGLVTPATVAEQILYEIGDPREYVLPDVVCDFADVTVVPAGDNRVAVSGARGRPPTGQYKVSATWPDGYRAMTTLMIGGIDAGEKARRVAQAILNRTRRMFAERNLGDYRRTSVEVIGAEDTYGAQSRVASPREVVLKIAVHHDDRRALDIFSREIAPSATSMSPGITGFFAGRPRPVPVVRLFSFLVDKDQVPVSIEDGEGEKVVPIEPPAKAAAAGSGVRGVSVDDTASDLSTDGPFAEVPLIALAHGRSGDKGNSANIGILARDEAFVPILRASLTEAAVAGYFAHLFEDGRPGRVDRFELPGLKAFNFLLHDVLDGGGIASLRYDPQGKAFAQMLLDMPIEAPAAWLAQDGPLAAWAARRGGP